MAGKHEKLYSKNGLAAKHIAEALLKLEVPSRIPRVSDFVEDLSLGRGTVQGALKLLQEMGAITLETKGYQGTYLIRRDADMLMDIAGIGPIIGAMPLPYSKKYEGLATGVLKALDQSGYRGNLAFMRGANHRLQAVLANRYDFAIVSKMAAEKACAQSDNLEIVMSLGEKTYVTSHRVFFASPEEKELRSGMKVGIDYSSMDQAIITEYECQGLDVELKDVNYMQMFKMLKSKKIDAAVWNSDENLSFDLYPSVPVKAQASIKHSKKVSEASIVIESSREDIKSIFGKIPSQLICDIQKKVENEDMFPQY
ncbi:GntR family transcriptional regulator YhfZ [Salipaludibacillus aurantiacus]|uniref:Helix-turn-helix domain-containing protein n=1 Tax=Salipaludibacillus aurantiacus TaxID=1601833 RepID=A0A1H9U9D3_9BACI|nr:GntR family transcriptional regulator YhfZ [Salipaludibacillus aurantiacus]SES05952.1 Helix-turn-helix domain-containing protein [Salipaludibacillus aurantiacus]